MRLKIKLSSSELNFPINNQHILNSYIHKCLGVNNEYHNAKSDYNISWLCGGKMNDDKLTVTYKNGAFFLISSQNQEFLNKMLIGIMNNPVFYKDMTFKDVEHIEEQFFNGINHFHVLSPFLIKRHVGDISIVSDLLEFKLDVFDKYKLDIPEDYIKFEDERRELCVKHAERDSNNQIIIEKDKYRIKDIKKFHDEFNILREKYHDTIPTFVTLKDDNFEIIVKEFLKNKLSKIDSTLDLREFDVKIDKNSNKNKIKKISILKEEKNIINHANKCNLSITCNKKIADILYNIGIGQSCGSGFGTIYKSENSKLYY